MKTKTFFAFLIVGVTLASCTSVATIAPRAENFSFVFKYTPCGPAPVDVLDSAADILVHTPLGETTSITIHLRLTDGELESIYQKAISISFFDYPSNSVVPNNEVIGREIPVSSYELSMTNGEIANSIKWTGGVLTKPSYEKADNLRELVNLINQIIYSHPEYKQLPPASAGCA